MKTGDLIRLLQDMDPDGNAEVVKFGRDSGFETVFADDFQRGQVVLNANLRGKSYGHGEHMGDDEYRDRFPHGRRSVTKAIVLPAVVVAAPNSTPTKDSKNAA